MGQVITLKNNTSPTSPITPGYTTSLRLCWNSTGIVLKGHLEQPDQFRNKYTKCREYTFNADSIEYYVSPINNSMPKTPYGDPVRYVQLSVGPGSPEAMWVYYVWNKAGDYGQARDPIPCNQIPYQTVLSQNMTYWGLEVVAPFSVVGSPENGGTTQYWRVELGRIANAYRTGFSRGLFAWSPTHENGFHYSYYFGVFYLDKWTPPVPPGPPPTGGASRLASCLLLVFTVLICQLF
eukprot:TRINITY_DN57562_c0_g2_i1.p1 TRINITY_DN57562_c0_g2~~TRINITY_DN57562_c0_g2_i1.p1  ORF type:complete len:236 (+),score=18.64 TRINITY_DN57562_c0_g2_i1:165-872(+)